MFATILSLALASATTPTSNQTTPSTLVAETETAAARAQCVADLGEQLHNLGFDQRANEADLKRALIAECGCRVAQEQKGQSRAQGEATCAAEAKALGVAEFEQRYGGNAVLKLNGMVE